MGMRLPAARRTAGDRDVIYDNHQSQAINPPFRLGGLESIDDSTGRESCMLVMLAELRAERREKLAAEALVVQLKQEVLLTTYHRYQDAITSKANENQAIIDYLRSPELATSPGVEKTLIQ